MKLPLQVVWEGPLPSPASSKQESRSLMRGYVQDLTELPLELYTNTIAEELAEPEAAGGSSALLQDRTAFLAELSSLKVLPSGGG